MRRNYVDDIVVVHVLAQAAEDGAQAVGEDENVEHDALVVQEYDSYLR